MCEVYLSRFPANSSLVKPTLSHVIDLDGRVENHSWLVAPVSFILWNFGVFFFVDKFKGQWSDEVFWDKNIDKELIVEMASFH